MVGPTQWKVINVGIVVLSLQMVQLCLSPNQKYNPSCTTLQMAIYHCISGFPPAEPKTKPDRPRKLAQVQSYSEFEVVSQPFVSIFTPPPLPPAYKDETRDEAIPTLYKIFKLCSEVCHLSLNMNTSSRPQTPPLPQCFPRVNRKGGCN